MTGCCDPRGCERMFGERFARASAERYRRRGLGGTARRIVELVEEHGVQGASVLEVGGGVGAIQVELLKRGAARTTNLELSPAYDGEAWRLLAEAGLAARAERRIADIAAEPDAVAAADIVVLHRVVCCYPDYTALLTAAADHARRLVVFSHPPRNAVSRTMIGTENLVMRLRGRQFRAYPHPPQAMLDVLAGRGMHPRPVGGRIWRIAVATRAD